jgi:hypothetical protein
MQEQLWIAIGALLAVAVASGFAEHRRGRRTDMDKVGLVPWPLVQFLALMGAVLLGIVAFHGP